MDTAEAGGVRAAAALVIPPSITPRTPNASASRAAFNITGVEEGDEEEGVEEEEVDALEDEEEDEAVSKASLTSISLAPAATRILIHFIRSAK